LGSKVLKGRVAKTAPAATSPAELEPIAGALAQVSHLVGGSSSKLRGLIGDSKSWINDAFSESLQQLQVLHEQQVSTLAGEVARLRDEVENLRKGARVLSSPLPPPPPPPRPPPPPPGLSEDVAGLPVPQAALVITNCDSPSCKVKWTRRKTSSAKSLDTGEAGEVAGLPVSPTALVITNREAPSCMTSEPSLSTSKDTYQALDSSRMTSKDPAPDPTRLASKETKVVSFEMPFEGSKDTGKNLSAEVSKVISHQLTHLRSERSQALGRLPTTGSVLLDEFCSYRQRRTQEDDTRRFPEKLVSSSRFDFCMGAVIVMNAVTIGLEVSMSRANNHVPVALQVAEYIFLFIYTLEIGLRFGALGRSAMRNSWVQFDLFLVICGFLDVATTLVGPPVKILDNVMLVRTFRLARLARVLRLNIKFHTLWMLVHGLLNSLATLAWTLIIICILLFVFAVLGLELLQPDPEASEEYNQVASEYFGSLLKATTSLLQGLTLDSFAVIYRPVMLAKPLMVFYFIPFLLVVSVALMNLVTAIMVNFSLEQASKDRQVVEQLQTEQRAEVVRILERAFGELDTNESGYVELEEMIDAPEDLRILICEVAEMPGETDIASIFKTLDFGNTGYLKIEDFCQGLLMIRDQKALESYFVMKYCSSILDMLKFRQKGGDVGKGPPLPVLSEDDCERILEESPLHIR